MSGSDSTKSADSVAKERRHEPGSPADNAVVNASNNVVDGIAEVSHELRLPIANIRLLVETLLDGALEDQTVCRRMLKRVFSEVERLQILVQDLLSAEQIGQSRQDLKKEWVELAPRAEYALESLTSLAQQGGVNLSVRIQPGFRIYANLEQLDQVLLNLLENAVKFTAAGGTVTIAAGKPAGEFSVSDTGIGIAVEEIPRIFQRFYKVDRSQSKGSTGLGLSIVKHIVELHAGTITVQSQPGIGSAFILHFPEPPRDARLP